MTRTGRDVLVTVLGNGVAPLAALGTAPVLATSLEVTGRGATAAATAPLLLATALTSLGLPAAVTHVVARGSVTARRALATATPVAVVIGLLAAAVVGLVRNDLAGSDRQLGDLIGLTSLTLVPNLAAALLQAAAAGLRAWTLVALERTVTHGGRFVVIAALAWTDALTVPAAVLTIALSPALGALVYVRLLGRCPRSRAGGGRGGTTGVLLSYGVRVWLGSLAGTVLVRLDQTLLTPLAGTAALGIYAVAVSVSDLPTVVSNAVREVTFSSQSADNDPTSLGRVARVTTCATLLTCAALAAVLPFAVPALFGIDFSDAVPVAAVLLIGIAGSTPGSIAGVGLAAAGRPGLRSLSLGGAAVSSVVTLLVLAPGSGAMGAAFATVVGNAVSSLGNLVALRWTTDVPIRSLFGLRRGDLVSVRISTTRTRRKAP